MNEYNKLANIDLTPQNYKTFFTEIRSVIDQIETQIQIQQKRFTESKKVLNELLETEKTKTAFTDKKYVSYDVYTAINRCNSDLFGLNELFLQKKMYLELVYDKTPSFVADVHAMEIESKSLEELRKMLKLREDNVYDIINKKFINFEQRFDNLKENLVLKYQENYSGIQKTMIETFKSFNEMTVDLLLDNNVNRDTIKEFRTESRKVSDKIEPMKKLDIDNPNRFKNKDKSMSELFKDDVESIDNNEQGDDSENNTSEKNKSSVKKKKDSFSKSNDDIEQDLEGMNQSDSESESDDDTPSFDWNKG